MKRLHGWFLLGVAIAAMNSSAFADKAIELKAKQSKAVTLIVDEKFTEPKLDKMWAIAKGDWNIIDRSLIGKEKVSDKHAAVISLNRPHRNSVIQFSFQLDGAKTFHLSFNHAKGHLFRVVITEKSLQMVKDKDKKDPGSKSIALAKIETQFEAGKWYTMLVEMDGDLVSVQVDNGLQTQGSHPGLDVDKTGYRFVASGQSVRIRDIKIWE